MNGERRAPRSITRGAVDGYLFGLQNLAAEKHPERIAKSHESTGKQSDNFSLFFPSSWVRKPNFSLSEKEKRSPFAPKMILQSTKRFINKRSSCLWMCVCVCVCMYVCVYVCTYVCMYGSVYICIYNMYIYICIIRDFCLSTGSAHTWHSSSWLFIISHLVITKAEGWVDLPNKWQVPLAGLGLHPRESLSSWEANAEPSACFSTLQPVCSQ